ncbi:uncharacterized protein LOC115681636 [Syzygium oleosum]|uniref:uncharacterized protein LOC115681636 n=1 Tax=Syzygium oleosum TaxID=219896 RepID=UPI0024B9DEEE|nr:uncharacterized protein LOC115681636 [Syzygium oleosum]
MPHLPGRRAFPHLFLRGRNRRPRRRRRSAPPNLVVDPEAAALGLQAEDELYPLAFGGVGGLYSRVVGEDDGFYVGYHKSGALATIPESPEVEYLGKLSPEMDRREAMATRKSIASRASGMSEGVRERWRAEQLPYQIKRACTPIMASAAYPLALQ